MGTLPTYVLERDFAAPPEVVWRGFTDTEWLNHWYGPGVESEIHALDVRPGGVWKHEMKFGGQSHYQRADYTEVAENEKLVWHHSNADADWNVTGNPMMPDWPRVLLTTVTFTPQEGGTRMRLTWVPHEASEAEIACFEGALGGMDQGWSKGMDMLQELVEA